MSDEFEIGTGTVKIELGTAATGGSVKAVVSIERLMEEKPEYMDKLIQRIVATQNKLKGMTGKN